MILLDTNVVIYLANGTVKASLGDNDIAYATITKIEALGYAQITGAEQSFLEELFDECEPIELDEQVIRRAIKLRQQIKITLGDAIVAASALVHGCELWTANDKDFNNVEGLFLHNPLK